MANDLKVSLHIKEQETGDPVCYKHDGERFELSNTVKLTTNTEYEFIFTLHPALHMQKLVINGETQKLKLCQNNQDEYEDVRTYLTQFDTTGFGVSKRGRRKEIQCAVELENGLFMKFNIQCKFYKHGERGHSHWGQRLANLELECKTEDGHNYVSIVNEKYF